MEMFQKYFIDILKNHYADFDGRARRMEFWMFILFMTVVYFALLILYAVGAAIADALGYLFMVALLIFWAGLIVPTIALSIRRLHDIGKPGVWWLIGFVPLIGPFILLYFYVLDSQPGENQFGPNPKESAAA